MKLIDSHAHLADEGYDGDRAQVLERARAAGVEAIVVIGYDLPSSVRAIEVATAGPARAGARSPALAAAVGFAPHNVADATAQARDAVRGLLGGERVVAVGEVGLDYHYDMPPLEQRHLFDEQLGWAREAGLPVVVHSREAEHDVVAALERRGAGDGSLRGVIHCFTESAAMASRVVELGFYVSFSGIVTFRNAGALRQTAATVPLERTLIETDSPYLAPPPHRGERNEPAWVGAVAECLAGVHGIAAERVAEVTAANARTLFGLA